MRDLIILAGMGTAIAMGVISACLCRFWLLRLGSLLSAATICVGMGYFGWLPLLGGSHGAGEYFGCVMLFVGMLFMTLFAALGQMNKAEKRSQGFPVELDRVTREQEATAG